MALAGSFCTVTTVASSCSDSPTCPNVLSMSGFFSLAAMHTKLPQCKPASLSRILCVITVAKKEDAAPARKHTPAQGRVGCVHQVSTCGQVSACGRVHLFGLTRARQEQQLLLRAHVHMVCVERERACADKEGRAANPATLLPPTKTKPSSPHPSTLHTPMPVVAFFVSTYE